MLTTSIDLSSAFDLVNVDLLIKRLIVIGLLEDVIDLTRSWLNNRSFHVSIDGENSVLYDLLLGTVQGSILGPVLYAIFVSPIFKITDLELFADDSFITKANVSSAELIKDMEKTLEAITNWLKQSGMKVNQTKTEPCLFYKHDTAPIQLKVGNMKILSKKSINVLGVIFNSKLKWENHVISAIKKASRSLNAIRLIRKHFTGRLVDFCRPAVVLNLKQPAEILPKKPGNNLSKFKDCKKKIILKLKLNCLSTVT